MNSASFNQNSAYSKANKLNNRPPLPPSHHKPSKRPPPLPSSKQNPNLPHKPTSRDAVAVAEPPRPFVSNDTIDGDEDFSLSKGNVLFENFMTKIGLKNA